MIAVEVMKGFLAGLGNGVLSTLFILVLLTAGPKKGSFWWIRTITFFVFQYTKLPNMTVN